MSQIRKRMLKADIIGSFITLKMETGHVEHVTLWDTLFYAGCSIVDWEICVIGVFQMQK